MRRGFPRATPDHGFGGAASVPVGEPVDDLPDRRLRHPVQDPEVPVGGPGDRAEDTQFFRFHVAEFRCGHQAPLVGFKFTGSVPGNLRTSC